MQLLSEAGSTACDSLTWLAPFRSEPVLSHRSCDGRGERRRPCQKARPLPMPRHRSPLWGRSKREARREGVAAASPSRLRVLLKHWNRLVCSTTSGTDQVSRHNWIRGDNRCRRHRNKSNSHLADGTHRHPPSHRPRRSGTRSLLNMGSHGTRLFPGMWSSMEGYIRTPYRRSADRHHFAFGLV
jgi:hypothetical protein